MKRIVSLVLIFSLVMSLFTFSPLTVEAATIPKDAYDVITFQSSKVGGKTYNLACTKKAVNGVPSGSWFFVCGNEIVTDPAILEKLLTIETVRVAYLNGVNDIINENKTATRSLSAVNNLGNVLVSKTIGNSVWTFTKFSTGVFAGNVDFFDFANLAFNNDDMRVYFAVLLAVSQYSQQAIENEKTVLSLMKQYTDYNLTYEWAANIDNKISDSIASVRAIQEVGNHIKSNYKSESSYNGVTIWNVLSNTKNAVYDDVKKNGAAAMIDPSAVDEIIAAFDTITSLDQMFEIIDEQIGIKKIYNSTKNSSSLMVKYRDSIGYPDIAKLVYNSQKLAGTPTTSVSLNKQYAVTATLGLNIRAGAGTSYRKVGAVPYNKVVTVTQTSGNWGYISYNGVSGWVCMDYLGSVTNIATNTSDIPNLNSTAYTTQNPFYPVYRGQCTAFVQGRVYEKLGFKLPCVRLNRVNGAGLNSFRNNAVHWYYDNIELNKMSMGYSYGQTPKANSIAVWSGGGTGHVAFVEKVQGNTVYFNEANWSTYKASNGNAGGGYDGKLKSLSASGMKKRGNFTLLGYIYLGSTSQNIVPAPQMPASGSVSNSNIAVGSNVTASWSASQGATEYVVYLEHTTNTGANKTTTVKTTSISFNLSEVGTYKISVVAKNSSGSSSSKALGTVVAHAPVTVTFVDYDDTILESQTVPYGGNATSPTAPSREGYTFQGWDTWFKNVTSDITVTATYKINTYTVVFKSNDTETITTQKIKYKGSAIAPKNPTPPSGYVFVGWNTSEYECVKSNLTVTAVYAWENDNLPIYAEITSANRKSNGSGYDITLKTTNYPENITKAKIVTVLKTTEGKMVASETKQIYLNTEETQNHNIFLAYEGVASVAEISVVGILDDDKTGVPLSSTVSATIDLGLAWSDWSENTPPEGMIVESRTEYRYRNKLTQSSSSNVLSGWELYDSEITSWGAWSGWQNSYIASSENRQVQTRWINPTYQTRWTYYRWITGLKGNSSWTQYNSSYYKQSIDLSYRLSVQGTYSGHTRYGSYGTASDGYGTYLKNWWWGESSYQKQVTAGYTQYSYRDAIYTHHFYKWDNWSEWSPNAMTANDNCQVETRTTYRYKSNDLSSMENKDGLVRTLNGNVATIDESMFGKKATLLVYKGKNTDPTASQLEYVGQTQIDDEGNYSFTYRTKEEPTVSTGDFIVMLGIEGATKPIYIETIPAPLPTYTVSFHDENGELIEKQNVVEGETAIAPEVPVKEGYTFVGWDTSISNVHDNLTIVAQYEKNIYSVIFVNWETEEIFVEEFEYGDELVAPDATSVEGKTFIGWDAIIDGVTTVTENMIVSAEYAATDCVLTFYDSNDNIIDVQKVKYGEAVETPEEPTMEGMVFAKWSNDDMLLSATHDAAIYPVFEYEQNVSSPTATFEENEETGESCLTLHCDTENATIHYMIFEDNVVNEFGGMSDIDPENMSIYSEPLMVSNDTTVVMFATADNMNSSEYVVEDNVDNTYDCNFNIIDNNLINQNGTISGEVSIDVSSTYGEEETVDVIVAVYDATQKLLGLKSYPQTLLIGNNDITLDEISVLNPNKNKCIVKIMIWSNMSSLKPLCNSISFEIDVTQ